jgi:hypothetical protein
MTNCAALENASFRSAVRALIEHKHAGVMIMWQMLLVLLSITLLVSTLIPSLRTATKPNKAINEPKERLKVIYPTPLSPLQRK